MTALSAETSYKARSGIKDSFGVAASTKLWTGALVCLSASGYLVNAADTAGLTFAGLNVRTVDNSDGSNADLSAEVYLGDEWELEGAGFAITDVGKKVYVVDNATIGLGDDANVDNHILVGEIVQFVDSTRVWVKLLPFQKAGEQMTIEIAGTNATALDLSSVAAALGGADIHVDSVQSMQAYVTADGSLDGLRTSSDYAVADGEITPDGDESANTLVITLFGVLV